MNSKHLQQGDKCPLLVPGSLRIYSMRFCPYAQRALLVAHAKGIKYDIVNINLINKPEFIFSKNAEGKVPTIESEDGKIIYESLIVADYIDEAYNFHEKSAGDGFMPPRLSPTDPFQRNLDRIWIEKFGKIITLDYQLYTPSNLAGSEITERITRINEQLVIFDLELHRRGTKFFCGNDKPGMLDYMIWPWMERLQSLGLLYPTEKQLLSDGWAGCSSLTNWKTNMLADNAVQVSLLSTENHGKYREMRKKGGYINYDFMI